MSTAKMVCRLALLIAGSAMAAVQAQAAAEQPSTTQAAPQTANSAAAAPAPPDAASAAPRSQQPAAQRAQAAGAPQGTARDRLDLDTTVVTGNRELPKVLYIVPWKKAELGALPGQPFNTLLDEVLQPVDRDVFRREVTYYDAVSSDVDRGAAAADALREQAGGSEK